MSFPKLTELAMNKIAENIGGDKLHPSLRPVPAEFCNKIFKMAGSISSVPSELLLNLLSHYLSVTEINLTGIIMTDAIVPMLKSHNLKSLSTGYFFKLREYNGYFDNRLDYEKYAPNGNGGYLAVSDHKKKIRHVIDIEQFLEDALNEESRKTLTHLDLSPEPQGHASRGFDEHFVDGWAWKVGDMLPSLTSLALRQRILPDFEFSNLCLSFPNLLKLDLTNTCLETLHGISALANLETLRVGCLKIKKVGGIRQLFDLKKLQNLSFEITSAECDCCLSGNVHSLMLKSDRRLRSLETVDFSNRRVEDATINRFLKIYGNLKSISVCRTLVGMTAHPTIEVYHTRTIQGCVKSLKYYTEMENPVMVDSVMDMLNDLLSRSTTRVTNRDFRDCLKAVNSAVELFSWLKRVVRHGFYCYADMLRAKDVSIFEVDDRIKMIQLLLTNSIQQTQLLKKFPASIADAMEPWKVLSNRNLLFRTPLLDLSRIAFLAFQLVEISNSGYARPHLSVLDMIKDVLDVNALVFESIDFKKVKENLKNLKDTGDEFNPHVVPIAKRLLEFVEIYFPRKPTV